MTAAVFDWLTPFDCKVYIDGQLQASGTKPAQETQRPVVLDALGVTWGRSTVIDQPDPSTCTFDVTYRYNARFADLPHVGQRVDVTATGEVPLEVAHNSFSDPDFEIRPVGAATNWIPDLPLATFPYTAVISTTYSFTGIKSAKVRLTSYAMRAWLPPADQSSDPAGWDNLPVAHAGEIWSAGYSVSLPHRGRASLNIGFWDRPNHLASSQGMGGTVFLDQGGFDPDVWFDFAGTFTVTSVGDGRWPGFRLDLRLMVWVAAPNQIAQDATIDGYTWATFPANLTWDAIGTAYIDNMTMAPPMTQDGTTLREVTVFSGRITDLSAVRDDNGIELNVIASDFTAELGNRNVRPSTWNAESVPARVAHIVSASGHPVAYRIDSTLNNTVLTWMQVDNTADAYSLLADVAVSTDSVLWSATHRVNGAYLWLADPRTASTLYILYQDPSGTGYVEIVPMPTGMDAIPLDSCDIDRDPVTWNQTVSDITSRVDVSWQLQGGIDPDSGDRILTQQHYVTANNAQESTWGVNRLNVDSVLTKLADAQRVGDALLARSSTGAWRVGNLMWETALTDFAAHPKKIPQVLDLLDGTRRIGTAIRLQGLPAWTIGGSTNIPLLLQGGQYQFSGGAWILSLTTSSALAQGGSLPWENVDAGYAWNEFDPAIAWSDLIGVGPQ